jgi:glycosyltransferase involved in cell wall biosynthesis
MAAEAERPSVCLTMIVRDEAHIVGEVLDATAPYIDYWVVVDTGSTDGTQELITAHMQRLAIPGELHERPWRDFGHNRSEALTLAQGRADYLWMMDADDTVIGVPPFGGLTADCYGMRVHEDTGHTLWRRHLFRDHVPRHSGALQRAVRGGLGD